MRASVPLVTLAARSSARSRSVRSPSSGALVRSCNHVSIQFNRCGGVFVPPRLWAGRVRSARCGRGAGAALVHPGRGGAGGDPPARSDVADPPWAPGYPLEGDTRACAAYASHLPGSAGAGRDPARSATTRSSRTAWWSAGSDFTGRPPATWWRWATAWCRRRGDGGWRPRRLRMLLGVAAGLDGVRRIVGRTEEANVASQRVMTAVGMQLVGPRPGLPALRDGGGPDRDLRCRA